MASIAEALSIAVDHHQSDRIGEAETLYRRILDADPDQPGALYFLGILLAQTMLAGMWGGCGAAWPACCRP